MIAAEDVSTFQNRLQQMLKSAARDDVSEWSSMLSNRHLIFRHPLLSFGGFEGPSKNGGGALATSGINGEGVRTCVDGWIKLGHNE